LHELCRWDFGVAKITPLERKLETLFIDAMLAAAKGAAEAAKVEAEYARRGLCYACKPGEIGGVIEPRIHLSQAAILFRRGTTSIKAAIERVVADLVFELETERSTRNQLGKRVTTRRRDA
jgi:hypothetical protein